MALTKATLTRHELNGLRVRVAAATDPGLVGVSGRVVVETERTLHIEDEANGSVRIRQVPKRGTTFEFAVEDDDRSATDGRGLGPAGEEPETEVVTVEGRRLVARPARRSERRSDPIWR